MNKTNKANKERKRNSVDNKLMEEAVDEVITIESQYVTGDKFNSYPITKKE